MNQLSRIALVAVSAAFFASTASAAVVPYDEEHFPDAAFRAQIESKVASPASASNKLTFETIDGVKYLNTNKLINFGSIDSKVTDLTGIKYFDHITSLDITSACQVGLKYVDLRGMTNLTALTYATYSSTTTDEYTKNANSKCILETLLLDGSGIKDLKHPKCQKLKHVSVRNCKNLQAINLQHCDLMGLDLTGCTAVSTICVMKNPNMTFLKLDENDAAIKYLFIGYTKITELNLSPQMSNIMTISMANVPISKLDLTGMYGKSLSAFYINGSSLIWVKGLKDVYKGNGTWTMNGTGKLNVGYVDSFQIHEPGDNSLYVAVNSVTGGKYDKSTGVFTFNEGVYTATIKIQYGHKSGTLGYGKYYTVTVTREKAPLNLFIEYSANNPIHNEYLHNNSAMLAADAKDGCERLPLTHVKDNEYSYNGYLMGNFRLVQVKEDGSEAYLGANSTQTTTIYPDMEQGQVQVSSSDHHAIHLDVTTKTAISGDSNDKVQRDPQLSWDFTTHQDEHEGMGLHMPNAKLTFNYVNGAPAGYFISENTPTGVDDIIVDNPGSIDDEDVDAQPEYFDLQGRRVAHPANGIYIERRGSKVTKRLIR